MGTTGSERGCAVLGDETVNGRGVEGCQKELGGRGLKIISSVQGIIIIIHMNVPGLKREIEIMILMDWKEKERRKQSLMCNGHRKRLT